jgi:hypothetical protein
MTLRAALFLLPFALACATACADPLPLEARLAERTAEVEKLKQEVSGLELQLSAARAAPTAISDSPPVPIHETVFLRSPDRPGATPWSLLIGLATVMLLVGFVAGWKTLDRRIRHKYGGLKIY